MRPRAALSILTLLTVLTCGLRTQEIIRCPDPQLSLSERWKWVARDGAQRAGTDFWVGYSIKRLMSEDSYLNSGNLWSGGMKPRRTIYDLVSGDTSRHSDRRQMLGGQGRNNIVKVLKNVAILVHVSGRLSDDGCMKKLEVSNMELSVDLRGRPFVWLGGAEDDQSVGLLKSLFDHQSSDDLKKDLLTAIGVHQNASEALPFLVDVLTGDQADNIRSQAAFWIGQQNRSETLPVLIKAAQNDRSSKVKEQAVFALSQLSSEESTEALISLARTSRDTKVRSKAAFWLGQKASEKAVAALESIVADDEVTEVQRQALFGLAQIHTPEGVERLIKIATTHTNSRIRKQAVQCLGQSDDPRALDALISIVRK